MQRLSKMYKKSLYPLHWLVLYLLAWALLSANRGWELGLPAAVVATTLACWLGLKPWRLRLLYLPLFLAFIVSEIFQGALDVALRTLRRNMPLRPAWQEYELATTSRRTRLLCSTILGLMPGTLASEIDGNSLRIHVLDERLDWRNTVRQLEQRLDHLLGEDR